MMIKRYYYDIHYKNIIEKKFKTLKIRLTSIACVIEYNLDQCAENPSKKLVSSICQLGQNIFNCSGYVVTFSKHIEVMLGVLTTRDWSKKFLFVLLFTMRTVFCFIYLTNFNGVTTSRVTWSLQGRRCRMNYSTAKKRSSIDWLFNTT